MKLKVNEYYKYDPDFSYIIKILSLPSNEKDDHIIVEIIETGFRSCDTTQNWSYSIALTDLVNGTLVHLPAYNTPLYKVINS